MNSRALAPPNDWLQDEDTDNAPLGVGFLFAATLLAAALRFYRLDGASLWVDEILTWNMIRPGHEMNLLTQVWDSIQAPLYLLVVWPLVRIQENEWILRLPAAVAGILTIPLFGSFLGRLLDHRAARLGTLLLAISPFHVWYSQEARGYSFLIFFVILMALAYLDMVEKDPRVATAIGFALAGAAAVLSNMSALFLLCAMGLAVLILHRPQGARQWGLWVLAIMGAVALSSPWILKASGIWAVDRILPGADTGLSLRGQTTFSPMAIPYSIFTLFFGHSFGPSLRELHQPDRLAVLKANLPWLLVGAIPVALGLVSALRHLGRRRLFLLIFAAVPLAILVALAVRNIKPWNPRYVAVIFPFLLVLLSLGLTRLPGSWSRTVAVLMIVLSFWSLSGYFWNDRYLKADIRGAVEYVQEHNNSADVIFVPVVTGVYRFYSGNEQNLVDSYQHSPLKSDEDARNFFKNRLARFDKFWFVSCREWYLDPNGHLPVVLSRNGHLRLEDSLPGVKIYHWESQSNNGNSHER